MVKSRYYEILEKFRVPKTTLWLTLNIIFLILIHTSMKHQWCIIGVGNFMREIVREVIILTIILKMGRTTKLIIDIEAYIMATGDKW